MALTTTQVNAAFVALLGRAAEGNANAWAVNSADTKTLASTILSVDGSYAKIANTNIATIEQAKTNEDFVEALYQTVLGRGSDADGKAVWLNALASGVSREELMTQFVTAAKAEDPELSVFNTSNLTFLSDVYNRLLNRPVDDSGQATWLGLLNSGVSRAEVVAKIIDAISSNPASSDYAIFNAKMGVANAVTAAFAGPKAGLNAAQNEDLNNKLVGIISSVTSSDVKATDEGIKAEIDQVVGSYEKVSSFNFKTVTDKLEPYTLGAENPTNSQTFRGTINLQDTAKSTINNKATLNTSNFSDTLVVDVITNTNGTTAFDYTNNASQVKTFANDKGIENLTINNGSAKIENLDNAGISKNLKIAGSADVDVKVSEALQYLEINNGSAKAKATVNINANLTEYKAQGVGIDDITVSGATTVVNKISTGAGDDKLLVSGSGTVKEVDLGSGIDTLTVSGGSIAGATINLGAGDDTIVLSVSGASVSGATIDGGAGNNDTLKLATAAAASTADYTQIKSISGIEIIELTGATSATSGATINAKEVDGKTITLKANANGSGDLTLKMAADETSLNISALKNDAGTGAKAVGGVTIIGITDNDTITLSSVKTGAGSIKETVTLKDTNIATGVKINNFATGIDKIKLAEGSSVGDSIASSAVLKDKVLVGKAINDVTNIIGSDGKVASELASAFSAATSAFSSSGDKGYIAQVKDNKTYLYEITNANNASTAKIDADDTVKLIATFDSTLAFGDFIAMP